MGNTVLYLRYSSHAQRDVSIEQQQQVCEEYASRHGLNIVDIYADRAVSGRQIARRTAFQRMLDDSATGAFDTVLVYQLDRFARNRYESQAAKVLLRQRGVRVVSALEYIADDPTGILIESVLEGYAEFYSADLARKIRRGMDYNAQQGLAIGGYKTLGYRVNAEKRFEPDPLTAPVVLRIFQQYSSGSTFADIVRYLNATGHRTAQGKEFNKNSIKRILQNRKYIGEYIYHGECLGKTIPPLVPLDLFERVQQQLSTNARKGGKPYMKNDYLLSHKVFCGSCGRLMIGITSTGRHGHKYSYYECRGENCTASRRRIRRGDLEDLVIDAARKYVLTDNMIETISAHVSEISAKEHEDNGRANALREKIGDVERNIESLCASLELAPSRTLAERLAVREIELEQLRGELASVEASAPLLTKEAVSAFLCKFKTGDCSSPVYRRALIDAFIFKCVLYDEYIDLYFVTGDGCRAHFDENKIPPHGPDASGGSCEGRLVDGMAAQTKHCIFYGSNHFILRVYKN